MNELLAAVRIESELAELFKKSVFVEGLGKGEWKKDGKGFRLTLEDNSFIRLKFFDAVKTICNSKLIEIPGRESWLSYLEVIAMPFGIKGYSFNIDVKQFPWGHAKTASFGKHEACIEDLYAKAESIGIELTTEDFETYYVGKM